ncbi:MAG: glycosyltransferase family 2 protein [Candidatus Hydrothermarchaeales archaeon]
MPNHNGSATIGKCIQAALSSNYENFEIIVVDDASEDDSVNIIRRLPCKLICLDEHTGASKARNVGALKSRGDILFFTDSDCLLLENTLAVAVKTLSEIGGKVMVGGTYTVLPYDKNFFSLFQSVFINFSETKKIKNPDYIAAHAMIIDAKSFRQSGGFTENFLPILEDVEYSHRLRRSGYRLVMNPDLMVQHIFNYSLIGSLHNAIRKSMYWTMYSIKYGDLLADSGTASMELKVNGVSQLINLLLFTLWMLSKETFFLYPLLPIVAFNILTSRKLIRAFYRAKGFTFAFLACLYYIIPYAIAVGAGSFVGIIRYYFFSRTIH